MRQTPNYKLQQPDYNNVADIEVLNGNFDILDRELKKKAGEAEVNDAIRELDIENKLNGKVDKEDGKGLLSEKEKEIIYNVEGLGKVRIYQNKLQVFNKEEQTWEDVRGGAPVIFDIEMKPEKDWEQLTIFGNGNYGESVHYHNGYFYVVSYTHNTSPVWCSKINETTLVAENRAFTSAKFNHAGYRYLMADKNMIYALTRTASGDGAGTVSMLNLDTWTTTEFLPSPRINFEYTAATEFFNDSIYYCADRSDEIELYEVNVKNKRAKSVRYRISNHDYRSGTRRTIMATQRYVYSFEIGERGIFVLKYNKNSNSWQELKQFPSYFTESKSFRVGDKLYFVSYQRSGGDYIWRVYCFDSVTENMELIKENFEPKHIRGYSNTQQARAFCIKDNYIYMGGTSNATNIFMRYPLENTLRTILPVEKMDEVFISKQSGVEISAGSQVLREGSNTIQSSGKLLCKRPGHITYGIVQGYLKK